MPGLDSLAAMKAFVEKYDIPFPNVADVDGDIWDRVGHFAHPSWIFIDGETGAIEKVYGELGVEELRARFGTLTA